MKLTYGIPMFVMKKYLVDLGAVETEENVFAGDNWQGVLSRGEPVKVGSLKVGRIDFEITGDEAVLEELVEKLHWKTLRGGG